MAIPTKAATATGSGSASLATDLTGLTVVSGKLVVLLVSQTGGARTLTVTDSDGDTILFNEFYKDSFDTNKKTICKTISPKNGDIIFFPAYVLHGVEMNHGRLRVNLTTDFKHELTKGSEDRLVLKSFINSMLRIKDL
jgi:hypothetical protein